LPGDTAHSPKLTTYFAPAERASAEAVRQAAEAVASNPVMDAALRSFSGVLMVLNAERQILALNDEFLRFLGCPDPQAAIGLRPGEALHCVHANDNPEGGCGTALACRSCGAVVAIVGSMDADAPREAECLLTARMPDGREVPFEFLVRSSPIHLDGRLLVVISLQDIRDQKRREALEAIFLHDLMNTVFALDSVLRQIPQQPPEEREALLNDAARMASRLVAEVAEQRDIINMEKGNFKPNLVATSINDVCDAAKSFVASVACGRGKRFACTADPAVPIFTTDPVLLARALCNLLKNALEATPADGNVRLACRIESGRLVFDVWNPGAMPPGVAARVFHRYFSTKGQRGRGLGTYGAKLIVQRYLGGRITFTTSETQGTTFRIELPLTTPRAGREE